MKVYILRHGKAEDDAASDELRELTERGRKNTGDVGQWLLKNTNISKIYASPFVRTRQTAAIVENAIKYQNKITFLDSLRHFSPPDKVWDEIKETSGEILLVSHMPLVSRLVGYLAGDSSVMFSTSGLACVEADVLGPGLGSLLFYRDV